MPEPSHRFIRIQLFLLCLLLCLSLRAQTAAQPSDDGKAPQTDPDRKQALEFLENGKMVQAMPLFEKLCSKYPKDAAMWERWGLQHSATPRLWGIRI